MPEFQRFLFHLSAGQGIGDLRRSLAQRRQMRIVLSIERKSVLAEGAFEEMEVAGKFRGLDDQVFTRLVEQGDDRSVHAINEKKLFAQQRQQLFAVHGGADVAQQAGAPTQPVCLLL